MTHSLVFASLKGGVGKTTVALNSAFAFAKRGSRTLLVDLDPQGAIGMSLDGVGERQGLAETVRTGQSPMTGVIRTKLPELHLLPMGPVSALEVDDLANELRAKNVVGRILAEGDGQYDRILFDSPGGLGGATRVVLEAGTQVIVVVQCEPLALRALPKMLELLASLRERGAGCSLLGVVGNMSSFRDPVMLASLEELWAFYRDQVFDTSIPRDPLFLQASRAGVPLGLLSRRAPAVASAFDKFVAEIEERLGLEEGGEDDGPIRLVD